MSTRVLRLCVVICAVLLILFILSSATASRASSTGLRSSAVCAKRTHPRGTVTFSSWQFPDTLNPYQSTRLVTREITNAIFDDLFRYDSQGHLIPQMARSIPTQQNRGIRDGGKTMLIQLKKGLRWSNGAEITAVADLSSNFSTPTLELFGQAAQHLYPTSLRPP